jgi:hypothetical protein
MPRPGSRRSRTPRPDDHNACGAVDRRYNPIEQSEAADLERGLVDAAALSSAAYPAHPAPRAAREHQRVEGRHGSNSRRPESMS